MVSMIVEGLREGHVRQGHEEAAASTSGTLGVASLETLGKGWTGSVAGTITTTKPHCGCEGSERWAEPKPDSAMKSHKKLK